MSKQSKGQSVSQRSPDEASKIAHGIQKPGQTKEQTKLIAQGIQKGIELYKKQQNMKNRELDKKRKQASKQQALQTTPTLQSTPTIQYKQHWLPWFLLVLSWIGISVYSILYI